MLQYDTTINSYIIQELNTNKLRKKNLLTLRLD